MLAIIFIILSGLIMNGEKTIYDFSSKESSGEWRIINDVVMGGASKSSMQLESDGYAKFSGTLSSDNNGGFASVRSYLEENDLDGYEGVIIKAKGDGNVSHTKLNLSQIRQNGRKSKFLLVNLSLLLEDVLFQINLN